MFTKTIEKYGLYIIVGLAIVFFFSFYGQNSGFWWDESVYLSLARNVYEGEGYYMNTVQESFRPPLFAYLIAGLWAVFGVSESLILFLGPLFAILSVGMTYIFARRFFGTPAAIWTSLLVMTSVQYLFFSERVMTEPLFVFLGTLVAYTFLLGVEKKSRYLFPLTGALIAITFLTRYAGILFFALYFFYPLWLYLKKKQNLFKRWDYYAGIVIFIVLIIPWIFMSITYYGEPTGSLAIASLLVDGRWFGGHPLFFFEHWISIFGLVGLFAIPGAVYLYQKKYGVSLALSLIVVVSLLFFMFIVPRKEERYLLHFFSFYYLVVALGIEWIRNKLKKPLNYLLVALVVILILVNAATAVWYMGYTQFSNDSLHKAGLFMAERIEDNRSVISNNIAPLHYLTDRHVFNFPEKQEDLQEFIEHNNVQFLAIDIYEPTYPHWLWDPTTETKTPSDALDSFTLEGEFKEWNKTIVWVYSI